MVAILTHDEYDPDDQGGIELTESWESYRSFWTAILSYAVAEGADNVYLRESDNEQCLGVEVGGEIGEMEPPPKELRRKLLTTIKRLGGGGFFGAIFHQLSSIFIRATYLGRIALQTPDAVISWDLHSYPNGIRLQRTRCQFDRTPEQ